MGGRESRERLGERGREKKREEEEKEGEGKREKERGGRSEIHCKKV